MALIPYTKLHATAAQSVAHLCSKGLIVANPGDAAREIDLIGYERLRIYFLSRRDLTLADRPFRPGTTYEQILRLYECDALLREACFTAVSQFELLLRNSISEALSSRHGSHPYSDDSAFKGTKERLESYKDFVGVYVKSKDQRAKHYKETYSDPVLPAIWTMKEFLTFGTTSRIFRNLNGTLRNMVAAQFGVNREPTFISWLDCLVDLRNNCAHHDRLFNRSFQKQPARLNSASLPTAPSKKLKAILECLDYLLNQRGAPAHIVTKVASIIGGYPEMIPAEAGF